MEFFKGIVSNVKRETFSDTTGYVDGNIKGSVGSSYGIFGDRLKVSGGTTGKIKGEIKTEHRHFLNFDIDDKSFRLDGDFVFKDGDKVALFAVNTGMGYYKVRTLTNHTKNFSYNTPYIQPLKELEVEPTNKISTFMSICIKSFVVYILLRVILFFLSFIISLSYSDVLSLVLALLYFAFRMFDAFSPSAAERRKRQIEKENEEIKIKNEEKQKILERLQKAFDEEVKSITQNT